MNNFNLTEKSEKLYLDLAANGNGDEKSVFVIEAMRRLRDGNKLDQKIIEVGPGGGSSVLSLSDAFERGELSGINADFTFLELDGVESESLSEARNRLGKYATSNLISGDLKKLNSNVGVGSDVITASAVFHEVYSYAGGYEAIDLSIGQIANNLNPEGYFAYRDVLFQEKRSLHERTRHIYDRESWVQFTKLFLKQYLTNAVHPYHHHNDRVILEQDSKRITFDDIQASTNLSLQAPIGLLREVQRHYITMRDYVWRSGVLGVKPILEGHAANDWIDIRNGHKRVHFDLTRDDRLLESMSEKDSEGKYVVDGDIFDVTSEILLGDFLTKIAEGDDGEYARVWSEWLSREGSETYGYTTTSNFIGMVANESLSSTGHEKILMPLHLDDIKSIPRAYYNRFLEKQLSNPLKDGKQIILFEAIDVTGNSTVAKSKLSKGLEVISDYCTKETIAQVYENIRRIT